MTDDAQRFRLALECSRDGLWDWDIVTNKMYYSPRWKEMLGYQDQELENTFTTFEKLVHPEDMPYTRDVISSNLFGHNGFYEVTFRMWHKKGHYVWILSRGMAYYDSKGNAVRALGFHTDVTKLKLLELDLKKNNELFHTIGEIAKIGAWEYNLKKNTLYWSDQVKAIHEVSSDYAPHVETAINFYHPDDIPKIKKYVTDAIENGLSYDDELRIITAQGNEKAVRAHGMAKREKGATVVLYGTLQDITAKKKLENALKKSQSELRQINKNLEIRIKDEVEQRLQTENLFKRITDTTGELLSYIDRNFVYRAVNKTYLEYHAIDEESIIGKNVSEIMGKEAFETLVRPNLERCMRGEQVNYEAWFEFKGSGKRFMEVQYSSYLTPDGDNDGVVVSVRDMTDHKALLEEKERKEQLLIQQSKMAAMGEMIGAIAHQWRQPLNNIAVYNQMFADLYRFGEASEESVNKVQTHISDQVTFMGQTIDDFKEFFKDEKEKTVFSLLNAILDIQKILDAQYKLYNIHLELQIENKVCIEGYYNEFKQVLINLLNNAKDILIAKERADGQVLISTEIAGEKIHIHVSDNGGGVPDELLPDKVFEPYVTTKGEKGTGIGLSLCRSIIEQNMHGKISAANDEFGAVFTITLPYAQESSCMTA